MALLPSVKYTGVERTNSYFKVIRQLIKGGTSRLEYLLFAWAIITINQNKTIQKQVEKNWM